jgi:hypothetical protein
VNIEIFHQAQLKKEEKIETMPGVWCWRKSVGIEKVGIYIPGGTAPLFSTVLMLGVPAKLAGCKEVVLCTPPRKDGTVDPATSTNSGDGTLSFGTNSSACSVNSTPGRITILKLGECVVNETSTATANFNQATFSRTVTITAPTSSDTDTAMVFNSSSSQYATASGDVAGFDITNAITIEAWIYPTGASCNGNIAGKATSYFVYCVSGDLSYAMGGQSGWSGVGTGITIPVNQWTHIALTRAASTAAANIYIKTKLFALFSCLWRNCQRCQNHYFPSC